MSDAGAWSVETKTPQEDIFDDISAALDDPVIRAAATVTTTSAAGALINSLEVL